MCSICAIPLENVFTSQHRQLGQKKIQPPLFFCDKIVIIELSTFHIVEEIERNAKINYDGSDFFICVSVVSLSWAKIDPETAVGVWLFDEGDRERYQRLIR